MPWPRSPRPTTGASPRSAFELPQLPQGEASPAALAAAEIKLGLAVLKYARHARGGRLDPAALSKHLDRSRHCASPRPCSRPWPRPTRPATTCATLHPKHEQFQRLRQALLKARGGGSAARPSEPASADPTAVRLPDGPQPQARLASIPTSPLLRQRLGLPLPRGAENIFDLRGAGCAQGVPGPQQHPDHGHADAAHALGAQWRRAERQAAAPSPRSPARRRSG